MSRYRNREVLTDGYRDVSIFDTNGQIVGIRHDVYIYPIAQGAIGDISGRPDLDNALESTQWTSTVTGLTGQHWDYLGNIMFSFENGPPQVEWPHNVHPDTHIPDASSILNRMSPNKPMVDLPLFLAELKDLPGMVNAARSFGKALPKAVELIRDAGLDLLSRNSRRKAIQSAADFHLQLGFGWSPLINDLATMLGVEAAIRQKQRELKRLASGKELMRTVDIADSETEYSDVRWFGRWENWHLHGGPFSERITHRAWATSRWKQNEGIPLQGSDSEWAAIRNLLGLNLSPSTLWNIIPWTFVIDYFTQIGPFLETKRNAMENHCTSFCIMRQTTHRRSYTTTHRVDWAGTGGTGVITMDKKSRYPIYPGSMLPAFTPILGERQVTNLASLAVARRLVWV